MRSRYLRPVVIDAHLLAHLRRQGLDLSTVPDVGRRIALRSNANWSTGGHAVDVTSRVHPHNRRMAEALAETLGLAAFALDFLTSDVSKSWREEGAVIEFNSTPGLSVMAAGGLDPLALGAAILGARPARIPLHLLLLAPEAIEGAVERARRHDWPVGCGWSRGGEAMIDGLPLACAGGEPWGGFQALIRQRGVGRVVVLAGADEVLRHGLPADRLHQVAFCGGEPQIPEAWARLLREASRSVIDFTAPDEFFASLA